MVLKNFEEIRERAREAGRQTLAVVEAADAEVLKACREAKDAGIADSILIGRAEEIRRAAAEAGIGLDGLELHEAAPDEGVKAAAALVREGSATMLMKGHISTGAIMKGVLDKENGLRVGAILSHTMVAQADHYGRLLLLSDAGLNIAPDADVLEAIIRNAVTVAHCLGMEEPKVACLSAIEVVNPKIPSTELCAEMRRRYEAGAFEGCVVDGPMALDLALSEFAVKAKGYPPERGVAGSADILIVPELVSGNVLGKSFIYLARYRCGGIIIGARVPVVLLSRSDTSRTKLDSIALACVYAQFHPY
ncbi:MAG: phosphate butyryltransferase [Planctomycetota bacterium]|nr:MAG: phosphate butyryltransferase [Planctomycetota bacterium]